MSHDWAKHWWASGRFPGGRPWTAGGVYRASAGSVYPTLQQLEDEELIVSEQKGGRRTYTLTGAGDSNRRKIPRRSAASGSAPANTRTGAGS